MAKARRNTSKIQNLRKSGNLTLFFVVGGALILIVITFFAFQKKNSAFTPEVREGPSLNVDKEKVDLGDVKLGKTVQVSFELKNYGNQPLQFSKAPYIEIKEGC